MKRLYTRVHQSLIYRTVYGELHEEQQLQAEKASIMYYTKNETSSMTRKGKERQKFKEFKERNVTT